MAKPDKAAKPKKHDPNAPKETQHRFFPALAFTPVYPEGDATRDPIGYRPDGLAPKEFLFTRVFIPAGSARGATYIEGAEPTGYFERLYAGKFMDCCTQRVPNDPQFPSKPSVEFARIWLDHLIVAMEGAAAVQAGEKDAERTVKAIRRAIPQGKTDRFL